MKKFILAFCVVVLLGLIGLFVASRKIEHLRTEKEEAAMQLKKKDVRITFPEGLRREQIATLLEKNGICSASDFLAASHGKEGYLFPDTYRFFPDTSAQKVVQKMMDDFTIRTKGLSPTKDQIILASIVEREAQNDKERAAIAGVYTNRLNISMKLDADPTVQYARDTQNYVPGSSFTFWEPITLANYADVLSPYNTYLQSGLPPGPIANPGRQSILAAMNPEKSDYLYFLHKDGSLLFAKTLEGHLANQ